jgi:major membrane immunogen (membrane-anchored lipoprotein)
LKSQDQNYVKAMQDKTKVNLADAMVALEGKLVSSQDAAKLDAVAGATTTSNDFKALAETALKSAK